MLHEQLRGRARACACLRGRGKDQTSGGGRRHGRWEGEDEDSLSPPADMALEQLVRACCRRPLQNVHFNHPYLVLPTAPDLAVLRQEMRQQSEATRQEVEAMRREQAAAFARLRISGTPMTVAPPLATCTSAPRPALHSQASSHCRPVSPRPSPPPLSPSFSNSPRFKF